MRFVDDRLRSLGDAGTGAAQEAIINRQVDDLDSELDRLMDEGVRVHPERECYDSGKFGWITDPEGNRVELWQTVATE
jgi:predicted enzyme related to lactoylglutathione lyase